MPYEAIAGGVLRVVGLLVAETAGFLLEYVITRIGRIAIYILTLGRVDTDYPAREGLSWLAAAVGILLVGGLFWSGWRIFS